MTTKGDQAPDVCARAANPRVGGTQSTLREPLLGWPNRTKRRRKRSQRQQPASGPASPILSRLHWNGDQQPARAEPPGPTGPAWWRRRHQMTTTTCGEQVSTGSGSCRAAGSNMTDGSIIMNPSHDCTGHNGANQATNHATSNHDHESAPSQPRPFIAISEAEADGRDGARCPSESGSSSSLLADSPVRAHSLASLSSQAQPSMHSLDWSMRNETLNLDDDQQPASTYKKCQMSAVVMSGLGNNLGATSSTDAGLDNDVCHFNTTNNNNEITGDQPSGEPDKVTGSRNRSGQGAPLAGDNNGHQLNKSLANLQSISSSSTSILSKPSSSEPASNKSSSADGCIVDDVRENFIGLIRYNKLQYFYIGVLIYSVINVCLLMGYLPTSGRHLKQQLPETFVRQNMEQSPLQHQLSSQTSTSNASDQTLADDHDVNMLLDQPQTVRLHEDSSFDRKPDEDEDYATTATMSELDPSGPGGDMRVDKCAHQSSLQQESQMVKSNMELTSWLLVLVILPASFFLTLIISFTLFEFNYIESWPQLRVRPAEATAGAANEDLDQRRQRNPSSSQKLRAHVRSIGILLGSILLIAPICVICLVNYYDHDNNSTPPVKPGCANVTTTPGAPGERRHLRFPVSAMVIFIYTIVLHLDEMSRPLRLIIGLGLLVPLTLSMGWPTCGQPAAGHGPANATNANFLGSTSCLILTGIALIGGSLKGRHLSRFTKRRVFMGANQLIEAKVSLEQQRQQQETLLLSVLPAYVAEQVKRNMVKKMASLVSREDNANGAPGCADLGGGHDQSQPCGASVGAGWVAGAASGGNPGSSWLPMPAIASSSENQPTHTRAPMSGPHGGPSTTRGPGLVSSIGQKPEASGKCGDAELRQLSGRPSTLSSVETTNASNNNLQHRRLISSSSRNSRFSSSLGSNEPTISSVSPGALTLAARQHYQLHKSAKMAHQLSLTGTNQQPVASNSNTNHLIQAQQHQLVSNLTLSSAGASQQAARRGFNELYIRTYNNVSLLYGDIVGFTRLCTQLSSSQLVSVLNDLFSHFDHLAERHKIMRIKILGDCYYGVSGIPEFAVMGAKSRAKSAGGDNHAINCVNMGLDMIQYIKCLNIRHSMISGPSSGAKRNRHMQMPAFELNMRIGVHTGHIHSGVIGLKKWQFDIWSNDVSIAMHCESSGVAGRVQVTEATVQHLHGAFRVEVAPGSERDPLLAERGIRTYLICDQSLQSSDDNRSKTVRSNAQSTSDEREPIEDKIREATIGTIRQTLLAGETANACPFNAYALALDHNDLNPVYLSYHESQLERSFERRLISSGSRLIELLILFLLLVVLQLWLDLHRFQPISSQLATFLASWSLIVSLLLVFGVALARSNGEPSTPSSAIQNVEQTPTAAAILTSHQTVATTSMGANQPIVTSVIFQAGHLDGDRDLVQQPHHLAELNNRKLTSLIAVWYQASSSRLNSILGELCHHFCRRQANSRLGLLAILFAYLLVILERILLISQQTLCQNQSLINSDNNETISKTTIDGITLTKLTQLEAAYEENPIELRYQEPPPEASNNNLHPKINSIVESYQLTVIIILIALDLSVNLLNYKMKFNLIVAILLIQSFVLIANPFYTSDKYKPAPPMMDMAKSHTDGPNSFGVGLICSLGDTVAHQDQSHLVENKTNTNYAKTQRSSTSSKRERKEQQRDGGQREQELIYRSSDALLLVLALWSLAFARQLDYTNRTNFLWRNRLNVDHEELEYISGINKVLLENILPSHVVQHYLTNPSTLATNNKHRKRRQFVGGQSASLHHQDHAHKSGHKLGRHHQDRAARGSAKASSPSSPSDMKMQSLASGCSGQMPMMMASNLRYLSDADELYHEQHESVAVMFASIPHFYEFYDESDISKQGLGCIALLNEIICDFDKLLLKNKFSRIEKIKTIGSTYMAAAGLRPCHQLSSRNSAVSQVSQVSGFSSATCGSTTGPTANHQQQQQLNQEQSKQTTANEHHNQLAAPDYKLEERKRLVLSQQKLNLICMIQFATSLMGALNCINKQSFQVFKLRVGVNTGPVIAGVIGAQRPFYDIWGDCVNIASRMESLGEIGRIHVEERTARLLMECLCADTYTIVRRGPIEVKGKGGMVTYFVDKRAASSSCVVAGKAA